MVDLNKAEEIYKKSIEVLEQVQLENGGCLATPKGERYPYVYPRDHAIIILGFLSAGLVERAKKGLEFVFDCQFESGAFPQRIDQEGNDASYKPIQIDGTGLILYALHEYVEVTGDVAFAKSNWIKVEKAMHYVVDNIQKEKQLVFTPNSIHEFPPSEKGLEIWANCICCSALDKMYVLSKKLKCDREDWKKYSVGIKDGILMHMWNSRIKSFVKNIRINESSSVLVDADASKYAIADFGVLEDSDRKVRLTVERIEKNLWHSTLGGLCRYPKYQGRNNGGWGPWPHFTLMVCRHFIRIKDKKNADRYLDWVLDVSYDSLLPEHISTVDDFEQYVSDFTEAGLLRKDRLILIENARKHPFFKKGIAYVTLPLAWPHAEFIRTFNLYKKVFVDK